MISIPSKLFTYAADKKSFIGEISQLGPQFKTKEPFTIVSSKTGKEAVFRYSSFVAENGEVLGWEYVSNPADNPNKETYKCIVFNT